MAQQTRNGNKWPFTRFRERYLIDGYVIKWIGFWANDAGFIVQRFAIIDSDGYVVGGFSLTTITRDEDVTYAAKQQLGALPTGRDDEA